MWCFHFSLLYAIYALNCNSQMYAHSSQSRTLNLTSSRWPFSIIYILGCVVAALENRLPKKQPQLFDELLFLSPAACWLSDYYVPPWAFVIDVPRPAIFYSNLNLPDDYSRYYYYSNFIFLFYSCWRSFISTKDLYYDFWRRLNLALT